MGDLMIAAFQTDTTRVCTFMLGIAAGGQTYPMLGIREGHHDLSHQINDPDARAKMRKIDRFNVSLFAYIAGRMKNIRDGESSLLDNSIVFYGSGLGNAGAHTPFDLPVLVAGPVVKRTFSKQKARATFDHGCPRRSMNRRSMRIHCPPIGVSQGFARRQNLTFFMSGIIFSFMRALGFAGGPACR